MIRGRIWPSLLSVSISILLALSCYLAVAALMFFGQELVFGDRKSTMAILSAHGQTTVASVTSTDPHNSVCYAYVVAGTAYQACSGADYPGEHAAELTVGEAIHIVYDSSDPSVSCACVPQTQYAGLSSGSLLLAASLGAIAPALVLYLEGRKKFRRRLAARVLAAKSRTSETIV
jgi:hypothetical protein